MYESELRTSPKMVGVKSTLSLGAIEKKWLEQFQKRFAFARVIIVYGTVILAPVL